MKTEVELNLTVKLTVFDNLEQHGFQHISNVGKQVSDYAQNCLKESSVNGGSNQKILAVHDVTMVDKPATAIREPGTIFGRSSESLEREQKVLTNAIDGKRTRIYEERGEAKSTKTKISLNEEKIENLRKQLADI